MKDLFGKLSQTSTLKSEERKRQLWQFLCVKCQMQVNTHGIKMHSGPEAEQRPPACQVWLTAAPRPDVHVNPHSWALQHTAQLTRFFAVTLVSNTSSHSQMPHRESERAQNLKFSYLAGGAGWRPFLPWRLLPISTAPASRGDIRPYIKCNATSNHKGLKLDVRNYSRPIPMLHYEKLRCTELAEPAKWKYGLSLTVIT